MSDNYVRYVVLGIFVVVVSITVIFNRHTRYIWSSSALPNFHSQQISETFTATKMAYEGYLFNIFPNESRLVRSYLDIVRDTVCGLTLRSREVGYTNDGKTHQLNVNHRIQGADWPLIGITMIGQRRLINVEWALRHVMANRVPGDFIECGVWRGGASIFARAVLHALNNKDKHVWLADSFQGLPKARTSNDDDSWSKMEYLKVSLEEVQTNFRSFNLLDDRVHFCKGYFVDSLPQCNISEIAVFRLDGDMYESTMDQLFNLYSKLQIGGIIIVDDYSIKVCRKAIHDFRNWHNITDEITKIPGDQTGIYWMKTKSVVVQRHLYLPLLRGKTNDTQ